MNRNWLKIITIICIIIFSCSAIMIGIHGGLSYNREHIKISWLNLDDAIRHLE